MLSTENMGGVVVTPDQLSEMQAGDYILHARDGVLNKVEVEKIRMPLDPQAHYQGLNLVLAPDNTIYAVQQTIISKSADGGRTWEHLNRDPSAFGFNGWLLQANNHGQLINVSQQDEESPITVWLSDDEGQTWERTSEIDVTPFQKTVAGSSLTRLSDGTLLLPIKKRDDPFDEGTNPTYVFVSDNDGHTFSNRFFLSDYGNEVNITELFPGRLLAVIRYQPGPPDQPHTNKTVFLADSVDNGATWMNLRQLTSIHGQCHGAAVGISNSRAVVALPIKRRDDPFDEGTNPTYVFVSSDDGHTFSNRFFLSDYGNEVNITELFPGRLLAVIRYQPGPPDQPHTNKTVFLADSVDNGATWINLRQLTSVHGQCHGAAVGLSNSRAVVAYDHRYPRELGSGRAMVSDDNGENWSDEVYYLCHGHVAGFPRHIGLDGEEILTFIGSCYGDVSKWENATGNSHFCIIRWRPV